MRSSSDDVENPAWVVNKFSNNGDMESVHDSRVSSSRWEKPRILPHEDGKPPCISRKAVDLLRNFTKIGL